MGRSRVRSGPSPGCLRLFHSPPFPPFPPLLSLPSPSFFIPSNFHHVFHSLHFNVTFKYLHFLSINIHFEWCTPFYWVYHSWVVCCIEYVQGKSLPSWRERTWFPSCCNNKYILRFCDKVEVEKTEKERKEKVKRREKKKRKKRERRVREWEKREEKRKKRNRRIKREEEARSEWEVRSKEQRDVGREKKDRREEEEIVKGGKKRAKRGVIHLHKGGIFRLGWSFWSF